MGRRAIGTGHNSLVLYTLSSISVPDRWCPPMFENDISSFCCRDVSQEGSISQSKGEMPTRYVRVTIAYRNWLILQAITFSGAHNVFNRCHLALLESL